MEASTEKATWYIVVSSMVLRFPWEKCALVQRHEIGSVPWLKGLLFVGSLLWQEWQYSAVLAKPATIALVCHPLAGVYISFFLASAKSDLLYDVYTSLVRLCVITLRSCGWYDPSHQIFSCAWFAQIGGPSCTSLCSITRSSSDVEGFVQSHSRTSLPTALLLKDLESFDHFSCADWILCMSWIEIPWIFVQFLRY
jgi:hypothetical protein